MRGAARGDNSLRHTGESRYPARAGRRERKLDGNCRRLLVIPAQAGIQYAVTLQSSDHHRRLHGVLDARLRGHDNVDGRVKPGHDEVIGLAGETAAVLGDTGANAADDLVHRAAGGERRSSLGEGDALLGHHAPRLALGELAAARKPHHAQRDHALRLGRKPCGIEGEFRPALHGAGHKGVGWEECKG
jgi:hypothetical protein